MGKFTKSQLSLYILNGLGVVVYASVFFNLNITVSNDIAFSTPDALTYLDVANWIGSGVDSESISIRPILFPFILLISTKLFGAYGIWAIQVIFWFLTINFTFLAIKKLSKSYIYAYFGALIIMSNLSLIALTFHALTEVTTVFLLSAMVFFLVKKMEQFGEPSFFLTGLFFLVLLSVLKPVFSIPMFCVLFIAFPLFYLKKCLKYPKNILTLFLILIPLFTQLTIIKVKYNQTKISLISSITFSKYLVAQGIQKIEAISRDDSIEKALSLSREQQLNHVYDNFSMYSDLFKQNIKQNIQEKSTFLLYPKGHENYQLAKYMKFYNQNTLKVHYVFMILILPLLLIFLKKKNYPSLIFLLFFYLLGAYYIVVTGISFSQGDRLTLPAIAIWACLYPFILFSYLKLLLQIKPKQHL